MSSQSLRINHRFSCAPALASLCLALAACGGGANDAASSDDTGAAGRTSGNAADAGKGDNAGSADDAGADGADDSGSAGSAGGEHTGKGGAASGSAGAGNPGSSKVNCGSDAVCASLNGLGVDTTKTPRVGPTGSPLPDSFNPFGGKVTALYPKQELYIGGLKLAGSSKGSAIVERHADKPGDPANNVMFQAAEEWTTAALHTAVAGDFDGNGRQEIAGIYVKDGAIWLHSIGDEKATFAVQDVQLAKFDVSAISAAAGDFDGDGKDELALAIAQTTGTKLLFLDDAGTLFKIDSALTKSIPRDTANSTLSFRLAAGNLDYDQAKELVLVTNEALGAFDAGQGTAHYFVYDDQSTKFAARKDGIVQGKDGSLYSALVAAPAVIDVDADGVGEVVLAGIVSKNFSGPVEMILVALDDAAQRFAPLAAKHTVDYRDLSDQASVPRYMNVLVNGLDLDGDLAQDIQVNQTVFSNFAKSTAPFSKLYEIDAEEFQGKSTFEFRADNATVAVGDLNGDKHDDIIALSYDRERVMVWGFQNLNADKKPVFGKIDSLPVVKTDVDWTGTPMLVPVNVDDDTSLLSFTEAKSDFVFTEPLVIAAIAAPPCQNGIGQLLDVCQTSFGTAQTQQISRENSVTLSASISVGVSFEDRTFTQSALEIEATATVAATATRGSSYSLEKSVTYTTGSMEDAVVFTTIPYDRYTYTIVSDPHPELIGHTTTISVPREPITLMVERSFYNEHVSADATKIDDAVFTHTIGERKTYPTPGERDQLLSLYKGIHSDEKTVGQGAGNIGVGLNVSNEISSGSELELGYEMSVKMTAGGVMGSFKVGASTSANLTVVSGRSTSYSGMVGAIDAAHFAQNQYNFGLFTYPYKNGSGVAFEVLNYWVK
jgi:hypothetical protein